jgi:hypothetical protein
VGATTFAARSGGGRGIYDRADGGLPVALRFPCPLARNERTGPLAGKERSGNSCSYNGGGRGIYCNVDGDLPGAPRTDVPGQAVAHRFHPGYTEFAPGADYHVSRGGGRGLYEHVDGDLPVAQALVQSPMPLSSNCEAPGSGAVHMEKLTRPGAGEASASVAGPAQEKRRAKLPGVPIKGFKHERIGILFYNIRGLISHLAELISVVRLLPQLPSLICLNETFLNRSIEDVTVEGYRMVARRDRDDGQVCGYVIVYTQEDLASRETLIEKSADIERVLANYPR